MVAALSFHIVATIAQPGWRWGMADLEVYRAAVAAMLQAQPLYQEGFTPANLPWLYPPFAAVLMMPWAVLPEVAAKTVMTVASVAALVLLMAQSWAATAVPRAWRPGLVLTCAAVVLVSEPMQQNLIMGQINVLLAAAVVHDFLRPAGDRRRGWLVGLAAGVKLTPALVVIYYAFRRDWSAVRNASLAFVGSVVIGFVVVPGESWTYWTRALWSSRIGPDHLGNQSLLGTLLRLAANTGWTSLFWLVSAGGRCGGRHMAGSAAPSRSARLLLHARRGNPADLAVVLDPTLDLAVAGLDARHVALSPSGRSDQCAGGLWTVHVRLASGRSLVGADLDGLPGRLLARRPAKPARRWTDPRRQLLHSSGARGARRRVPKR